MPDHDQCDRALATANNELETARAALANALTTNTTLVDALVHVAACEQGCPDCRRIARQALE